MVRPTDRPMRRESHKICENFALKVFDFSIVSASDRKNIYKKMTERNFVVLKQKEKFHFENRKIFSCEKS